MTAKIKSQSSYAKTNHKHKPKGVTGHSFEKVYWPYIPLLLFAFTLFGLAAKNGALSTILKHPAHSVLAYASNLSQNELLLATNTARADNNQKPLKINSALTQAAQSKANDMALRNYWSHNTPGGNPPWVFVSAANYQYDKIGENLAAGFTDSQATINGWMASPEHRDNMLDRAYNEVGFGYANNPNYTSTGNTGPMTIVVAFYGQPVQATSSLDNASAVSLAAASSSLSGKPPTPTSRAQSALSGTSLGHYATYAVITSLIAVLAIWVSRHALALKKSMKRGEKFVMSHPLFDLAFLFLAVSFYIFSRTSGFTL